MRRSSWPAMVMAIAMALVTMAPAPVRSQAEVTALASGSDPIESTDELRLSRFADFSEETTVAVGTMLEVGDLLTSGSESIDVELACGQESVLRFSGGFRLLINSPDEVDCAVDLLSGTVDVLTDTPTEVGAGDVTLGVEGTQFSLSLVRTEEGPEEDLAVFEGKVRVRSGEIDSEVETGNSWKRSKGEQIWGKVSEVKSERTAALFARIEVAKSIAAGEEVEDKEKVYSELRDLHLAVLSKPAEAVNRVKLAKAQLELKRDSTAAYHLKRADVTTEEELDSHEIDKRVMPLFRKKTPSATTPGSEVENGAEVETGGSADAQSDPFTLIRYDRYREAIEILEKQAGEAATAKIYYGLAKAYAGLEGSSSERAGAYADRALTLHKSGDKLPHEQYMACRRIRARANR